MKIPEELKALSKREIIRRYIVLEQTVERQQTEIEDLKKRLLAYENAHTPPSQDKRRYPEREKSKNKVGAPKGHKGTTRKRPEPTETKELHLDKCPDCNTKLGNPIKTQKRIVEEIPEPQPLRVIEFLIPHYKCNQCKKEVIPKDPELPEVGNLGYNLQTEIVHLKVEDRLPLRKIPNTLNRRFPGLGLVAATILDVLNRVTKKLEPEYEKIEEQVRASKVVNADETGAKIQGKKAWFWVFICNVAVLFTLSEKREQKVIERVLGKKFTGILGCDGWKSYSKYSKLIQRCWAHLLREAKFLAQSYEGQARLLYNELCNLFNQIKEVTVDTSRDIREKVYNSCILKLKSWINTCRSYKELRKFVTTLENGLDHWFTCVLHPEIEPTNNKAERALREFVVQRKITGTLRNQKGMHITEVLMSVLATYKLQGKDSFSMLRQVLSS